ncbi:predicted protein [Botrytis cinerea T4]|uniref:Uncharacterized protein n=1 Tax=Botryotinia fuckeliana (strain T4) TaxID=999810 RepID=G2YMX8_BOTF4|nr:predicted protein [Botrytis cinerea T4]
MTILTTYDSSVPAIRKISEMLFFNSRDASCIRATATHYNTDRFVGSNSKRNALSSPTDGVQSIGSTR